MQSCDVQQMLKSSYEDPCFFINFHNVGRGLVGNNAENGNSKPYIKCTKTLNCWRIVGDKLQKVDNCVILFNAETYIFQWILEVIDDSDTAHEETLFYYWKGSNASKGFSPLPPEIENQNTVVDRICQWSEPALFFHMFPNPLLVFNGFQEKFDHSIKRLFIVRGELTCEIHLYEVPCSKESLRSRGVFLLLNPNKSRIYFWYGSAVPREYQQLTRTLINLNERDENWMNYEIVEIKDGCDDNDTFFESLECQTGNYLKLPYCVNFTPRLFYFNSITGDFLASEVEYPLRSKQCNAAFSFLQSHLYTADQPALFLLDNDKEIWLWEGWKTPESNIELFEMELQLAKETANNYAKEKNRNLPILVKHVLAGLEPLDFINIFPYWTSRNDIADLQLQHKY